MDSPLFDGHFQVALVDRNEEVQALSAKATAQTLAYGVGFGRPHWCSQYSHAYSLHASVQVLGKDAIQVVDHESIGMIVRKRLSELLQGPLRRWVAGHVLVENSTCPQFHDHEYVKGAESGRDYHEEIARHNRLGMVMDEGQPTLLWIGCAHRSAALQVLLDGAGRNPDPEFQLQLVGDALFSPGRILGARLADKLPKVVGQTRPPRWFRLPAPKEPESFAVPTDERIRLHV